MMALQSNWIRLDDNVLSRSFKRSFGMKRTLSVSLQGYGSGICKSPDPAIRTVKFGSESEHLDLKTNFSTLYPGFYNGRIRIWVIPIRIHSLASLYSISLTRNMFIATCNNELNSTPNMILNYDN